MLNPLTPLLRIGSGSVQTRSTERTVSNTGSPETDCSIIILLESRVLFFLFLEIICQSISTEERGEERSVHVLADSQEYKVAASDHFVFFKNSGCLVSESNSLTRFLLACLLYFITHAAKLGVQLASKDSMGGVL